ncbi:uncharacterized protein ACLA_063590 [Aspergillus clavatus NRRL 1]|uniref:Uncharacterized protein n=1 Tax=Aspergillus clavatus (strain ATCC 1007 / CBS 513.65 / DSM 816 / NCTC 3887 / NRRL 1 / QM 1276 / 107) TaxID=344612 RepID=A1CCY4_ASPCL|nr:uncharacterized protein ACLA_063590 [Aspergillus clavatus NRRL 1]EAW12391.1 conserved hypothetical protein [Aspergillus clavatus NRRL 1]
MSATPIFQSLSSISSSVSGYSRQQLGTLRNRLFKTEKSRTRANLVQTSFALHRPVWVTAGGAMYTTMGAVYLTLRYMSRLR